MRFHPASYSRGYPPVASNYANSQLDSTRSQGMVRSGRIRCVHLLCSRDSEPIVCLIRNPARRRLAGSVTMNLKDANSPSLLGGKWPPTWDEIREKDELLKQAYLFFSSHPQMLAPWRNSIEAWKTKYESLTQ